MRAACFACRSELRLHEKQGLTSGMKVAPLCCVHSVLDWGQPGVLTPLKLRFIRLYIVLIERHKLFDNFRYNLGKQGQT